VRVLATAGTMRGWREVAAAAESINAACVRWGGRERERRRGCRIGGREGREKERREDDAFLAFSLSLTSSLSLVLLLLLSLVVFALIKKEQFWSFS